MTTISEAHTLRSYGRRDRSHLLLRHLLFGLGEPGSAAFAPVGLGRSCQFGNKLTVIALVDTCFAVTIDLTLIPVVDAGCEDLKFLRYLIRDKSKTREAQILSF